MGRVCELGGLVVAALLHGVWRGESEAEGDAIQTVIGISGNVHARKKRMTSTLL